MFMLRKSWLLGITAACAPVLWFALLAQSRLYDPDEGRYAEIPREMLNGGDWVIPRLNALVYLEKPPLQYWLTALAYRAFGQSEFAARLCTGVAGLLSLVSVFLIGPHLWGFDSGLRALLLTAASALFVLVGHQLTLDMLLSFCLTAALGCLLMAQMRRDAARGTHQGIDRRADSGGQRGLVPGVGAGLGAAAPLELSLGTAAVRPHRDTLVRTGCARQSSIPQVLFHPRAFRALPHADRTSHRALVVLCAGAGGGNRAVVAAGRARIGIQVCAACAGPAIQCGAIVVGVERVRADLFFALRFEIGDLHSSRGTRSRTAWRRPPRRR